MSKEAIRAEIYEDGLPLDIDAVLYYLPKKGKLIQYTRELEYCPVTREVLKAYLLEQYRKMVAECEWTTLGPIVISTCCADLGLHPKVTTVKKRD